MAKPSVIPCVTTSVREGSLADGQPRGWWSQGDPSKARYEGRRLQPAPQVLERLSSASDKYPKTPAKPDVCRLSYRDALGEESTIVVGDRAIRSGRAPHCDLVLGHESISREHAEIVRNSDGWAIADLGSKNGLKINTYKTRQQQLRDGDCIDIGAAKLWVEIGPVGPTG